MPLASCIRYPRRADGLLLEISVPPERRDILEALAQRAIAMSA